MDDALLSTLVGTDFSFSGERKINPDDYNLLLALFSKLSTPIAKSFMLAAWRYHYFPSWNECAKKLDRILRVKEKAFYALLHNYLPAAERCFAVKDMATALEIMVTIASAHSVSDFEIIEEFIRTRTNYAIRFNMNKTKNKR